MSKDLFTQLFPLSSSYVVVSRDRILGVFNYRCGREKASPMGFVRICAINEEVFNFILSSSIKKAKTEEKIFLRTINFGYNTEELKWLREFGFKVGVNIPKMVSFDGKLYNYYALYMDLSNKYEFNVKREYVGEELYPEIEIEKAKNYEFKIRAIKFSDLDHLIEIFNQVNVFRTMGRGIYEGMTYFNRERYWNGILRGEFYTLVCEDVVNKKAVGFLTLENFYFDVLKGVGGIGMFVDQHYQGLGVGTLLMEKSFEIAKKLHLRMLKLSVFNTNIAGLKLYTKMGFKEFGRLPGWLQNGYVEEIVMAKKLYDF